jgi:DNA-binding CsgD family transcriptional regulator
MSPRNGHRETSSTPGDRGGAPPPLVGRREELRVLEELLESGRDHGGGVLVRGEAGIGKTELLAAANATARGRGYQVLSTVGLESESHLPFAGLHRLLRPLLDTASRLPGPQRSALLAAFGMAEPAAPGPFLIGLATLNLLSHAATAAPLLILVDDAQWLDAATCQVLAFVARRLESDPVVMVAVERHGQATALGDAGLAELEVGALADADAAALLDARAPILAPAERARMLATAAGNPLALVELPVARHGAKLGADEALPVVLPMTTRLERSFASRLRCLARATRALLLVAALDDADDLSEILAAAASLDGGGGIELLEAAVADRLVWVADGRLRFRHPLIRSAIVAQAGEGARRTAHAALAGTVVGQPDRRAWHRAQAASGPDEEVAAEVEAAAVRARHLGGIQAAIRTEEQAASLTPDPHRRASRLLAAAEMAFESGVPEVVERLVLEAQRLGLTTVESRRAAWVRELFEGGMPGDPERVRALVEAADAAREDGDVDLCLNLLVSAAFHCWWSDPGEPARARVVDAVGRCGVIASDPRALAVLGVAAPITEADRVMAGLRELGTGDGGDPDALRLLGMAAFAVGDFESAARFAADAAGGLRAQGRLALLVHTLATRAHAALELGDMETAVTAAEECRRLAEETRQPIWLCSALTAQAEVLGMRGDLEQCEALLAEAERRVLPRRLGDMMRLVESIRGNALLTAGRHAEAYQHLRRCLDPGGVAYYPRVLVRAIGTIAEAAAHTGHRDEARALLDRIEQSVGTSPSRKLRISLAHASAVLADEANAEPLYLAGLSLASEHWRLDRARLQLAYGSWLRRRRRYRESRAPLRAAGDTFEALGLPPWSSRARQELRASGESRVARTQISWTTLSPQELQIARMAADGLSNAEIGERLFLSHRTVGSHLYRVFPKLGITARAQLRDALGVEPFGHVRAGS